LDLGIAAAETAPGQALPDLRRDFDRINEIIASLATRVGSSTTSPRSRPGLGYSIGSAVDTTK
jgi:hypothetical protein